MAFAPTMEVLRIAAPSTVVHIDRALARVGRVVRLIGAARARAVICAAAAYPILSSLAIGKAIVALVAVATRVTA